MQEIKILKKVGLFFLVLLLVIFSVFPFYYAIVTSFKSGSALFKVDYYPKVLDFSNYVSAFTEQPFHLNIFNSVIVAVAVVVLSLFLGVTASFALGRVKFRGRGLLLLTILAVSMFPQVAVLSGMFELIRWMGLYNSLPGLMITYMIFTLPFTVWVLTTFMRDLPKELEEASIMDGASPWVIITKVFMPLLWPALVTTGLLAFIAAWNEFLFALTFILQNETRTVPVAIASMGGASEFELPWGSIMAGSVVVTIPVVALVLIFQRRIVSGLTAGAVKG
ncbi:MAG: carbohydrate ABC transporter permease [SAR324 cluster bacterium]|nr:carbohydrate ABC transporter permease [SAR324 cluster bacterium]